MNFGADELIAPGMRVAGAAICGSLLGVDSVRDEGELRETDDSEEGSDDDEFARLE